ncbi:hypothetical protein M153_149130001, partial [Pseudoloma neurophilia]
KNTSIKTPKNNSTKKENTSLNKKYLNKKTKHTIKEQTPQNKQNTSLNKKT